MDDKRTTGQSSPVIFKRKAEWAGIRLEHYRFSAGELPEHCHPQHIMIMPFGGGCNGELRTASGFRIRGRQTSTGVCIIPAGMAHRAHLEGASEHLALYLEPSVMLHAATEARLSGNFEVVEKYAEADPVIHGIGMALAAELESEGLSARLYGESLANVLAVHLLRHYTTAGIEPHFTGGLSGQRLRQVMAFISENYACDLKLAELARVAGMSSFHFAREFKRATGTTPHQYLIRFRIERAKAFLIESEMPLIEVGLKSGFSHQSHFTRIFRKLTGTTPQSYRFMLQN